MSLQFTLNGKPTRFDGAPDMPLLWYLRDHAGLTGTKFGCGIAACGAFTVHVDGKAVRACVTPDDPTAKALKYVDDASAADRPDKMGVPGEEQHCANCQFIQGAETEEWRPCMLFPGKAVNANGWCTSWTPTAPSG